MTIVVGCASIPAPDGSVALDSLEASDEDDGGPAGTLATSAAVSDDDAAPATTEVGRLESSADGDAPPTTVDSSSANEDAADSPPVPPFDTGDGGVCSAPPASGDLIIDELMIESVAGSGDHGQWLEVQSTAGCAFDLKGLHGEAPNGSKVRTFQIADDFWIPAHGTFVIADSSNPAINHSLPDPIVVWSGEPGDVLRHKGGTVTLILNGLVIDSVTYPSMTLTVGATLAFPADCAPARRADWASWQTSASSWFPGFRGTPNAPNDDVQCP